METQTPYRRIKAATLAALFMLSIIILVVALPEEKLGAGVVLGVIVAAPLLLYLIASGDVAEVSGPGGFAAKFKSSAKAPVDGTAFVSRLQMVEKLDIGSLKSQLSGYRVGTPLALVFELGAVDPHYNADSIRQYIEYMVKLDPLFTVVFVGVDEKFIASMDGKHLSAATYDNTLFQFAGFLNTMSVSSAISSIQNIFPISRNFIFKTDMNSTALKRMMDDDTFSIVVLDETRTPTGIARRDRIVAQLVSSLAA